MVAEWSRDGPEMVTGLTRFTHDIMCMLLRLIWKWVVIKFRCKGTIKNPHSQECGLIGNRKEMNRK